MGDSVNAWVLPTGDRVNVVGEGYYQDELDGLCGGRTESGHELECLVFLVPETDNPHDPKAVKCWVHLGEKMVHAGYLSRADARAYRPAIDVVLSTGKVPAANGLVVGGWYRDGGDDVGHYGVWMKLCGPDRALEHARTIPGAGSATATPRRSAPHRAPRRKPAGCAVLLALVSVLGAAAASGCMSVSGLRDQPPVAVRTYQGDPDEIAACILRGDVSARGLTGQSWLQKTDAYVPGRLVEIENVASDHLGVTSIPVALWTLRLIEPNVVQIELRLRGTRPPDAEVDAWFAGVARCAGARR